MVKPETFGHLHLVYHFTVPLMQPHHLRNFEIPKYYQNEPRFNGVYSRNNLPKIKEEAYIINLDECELIGSLCM